MWTISPKTIRAIPLQHRVQSVYLGGTEAWSKDSTVVVLSLYCTVQRCHKPKSRSAVHHKLQD